jgi:hypothetical protein
VRSLPSSLSGFGFQEISVSITVVYFTDRTKCRTVLPFTLPLTLDGYFCCHPHCGSLVERNASRPAAYCDSLVERTASRPAAYCGSLVERTASRAAAYCGSLVERTASRAAAYCVCFPNQQLWTFYPAVTWPYESVFTV